ncbi:hypothetical protein [Clostridium estertheticum]|uniref:hypothetical protein n=1 Tax=Clostridium estertheticum TaxID=238834 RepID=UPI001CF53833|nr:hypothetical protein [Clostridium estertheticum]MCB2354993.1 hypothetical protein [Clostridium estertheticum]WAG41944.1 hypothetical protein LL065_04350 [Clostridium estertheticum]
MINSSINVVSRLHKIKQVFVNRIINDCEAMDEIQMRNIFDPYNTTKPNGTSLDL